MNYIGRGRFSIRGFRVALLCQVTRFQKIVPKGGRVNQSGVDSLDNLLTRVVSRLGH